MINPQKYEIVDANVAFGNVSYPRPCVIVSLVINGYFSAVPMSSAQALFRGLPYHLAIDECEPDFKATGLARSSFALGDEVVQLNLKDIIRPRGRLEGKLLIRFTDWI